MMGEIRKQEAFKKGMEKEISSFGPQQFTGILLGGKGWLP